MQSSAAAKRTRTQELSPFYEDELLDWDVPPVDTCRPLERLRVRVRDVEIEQIPAIESSSVEHPLE